MHMKSLYQDHPGIHTVSLANLSPMSWHADGRWEWRDLPKIKQDGLWYPILYYKVTPDWWHQKFANWKQRTPEWPHINPPIVNGDGMIWAVKMGTNRLLALKHLCYTTVDAICFDTSDELVQYGVYLRDGDPLHE